MSPSMRTQTNFRLSLISARDKRQGEIRLVLTGYKVLKFLVESLLDVTGEGENWTSAIRKSSSLRWKPEHVREQRRGWRSKATNLGVLKDTSMAKIVTYRHWTSYKWDLFTWVFPWKPRPRGKSCWQFHRLRFASKVSPAPPCSQVEVVVLPGFRCYLSPCRVCALGVVCFSSFLLQGMF